MQPFKKKQKWLRSQICNSRQSFGDGKMMPARSMCRSMPPMRNFWNRHFKGRRQWCITQPSPGVSTLFK